MPTNTPLFLPFSPAGTELQPLLWPNPSPLSYQSWSLAGCAEQSPCESFEANACDRKPQTIHFLKTIKDPRFEDYNIRYRYGNRFAYLGNGDVKALIEKDYKGLAPYVRNSDHDWSVA